MSSSDYIPPRDADFDVWANGFVDTVKAKAAEYGLTPENIAELEANVADWDSTFTEMHQRREAAKAATVGKDNARKAFQSLLRSVSQQIQADPNVDDILKADAGLPIRSTSRTPVKVPTTAPIASIETCNVRENFLQFSDAENMHRRFRPNGVMGIEIWMYVGNEAPVTDDQYHMYSFATRMNATVSFTAEQAGKSVWYHFRYVNRRGEKGPWSMVYSSTVTK